MSFHSPQKFGISSIIDELTRLKNSFPAIVEEEQSFTFQQLPKQSDRVRITRDPYLEIENETYGSAVEKRSVEESFWNKEESGIIGKMDFFQDVEDFQSRKEEISNIQKRYLSVVSNNQEHRRSKMKIFSGKTGGNRQNGSSIKGGQDTDENEKPQNREDWVQSKRKSVKNILGQLQSAVMSCYAHLPDKETVLEKFGRIAKRA